MDNLSQLHCVFDILSGALSSGLCACTIRRRSTSPVACTAALGTCKLLEEPRGIRSQHASSAMEVLRTAQTGLQRQCRKLGPRSEKHNNSRWANQRPVTIQRAPWSNRWTATKIRRGCILYRGRRYQRGTPTSFSVAGWRTWPPRSPTGRFYGSRHRLPMLPATGVSPIRRAVNTRPVRRKKYNRPDHTALLRFCSPHGGGVWGNVVE